MNRNIQESAGRTWFRLALFILVFIVAVWSISNGILRLLDKHTGYYEIIVDPDDNVKYFRNGVSLYIWLEGNNNQIKLQQRTIESTYRQLLLHTYQLFDTQNEYAGISNLATLNKHLGEDVVVSADLFSVLSDMWEKTQENRGVNLFGGAFLSEYDSILTLTDIQGFEPDTSTEYGVRLIELARRTSDLSQFNITFDRQHLTVNCSVADEYLQYLESIECPYPVISLGRMADAYRLSIIRDNLETADFTKGFLSSDSGLTVSLSSHDNGQYVLYGYEQGQSFQAQVLPAGPDSAYSFFHAFPLKENQFMYHKAEKGWFHPTVNVYTGICSESILASGVVAYDGNVVRAAYENLMLFHCNSQTEVQQLAESLQDTVSVLYY